MRITLNRRSATAFGLAAATAGAIAFAAGPASADATVWLSNGHNVGVYNYSSTESGSTNAPVLYLSDGGDWVNAVCWIRGQTLQNMGNVWYYIDEAYYTWIGVPINETGYVYGGYIDDNAAFHQGLPHCNWGP
jgi:hypothetical protein